MLLWPLASAHIVLRLVCLAIACGVSAVAHADALGSWRKDAAEVRRLAENDAPRAYREAKRLEAALPADAPAADRARMLNLLSRIELYLALTRPAADHAEAALELAKQHDDKVGQAEANLNITTNAINEGRLATVMDAAVAALSVLDGVDRPDLLIEAMLRTAMAYQRHGQLDAAVTLVMQAMDIAQRSQDPLALAYAYHGLAVSNEQTRRYPEALEHFTRMREYAVAARSRVLEAHAVRGMGMASNGLGDLKKGEAYAREAVALCRAAGTPFYTGAALFMVAATLHSAGRHQDALKVFDEVAEIYQRNPNKIALWWTLDARSGEHLALGHISAGMADAEAANSLAQDLGAGPYLVRSVRRLAEVAAAAGNHRRAYELSVRAAELAASAEAENSADRMVALADRFQSESKQRHIDELTQREHHRALERRWLWTVLGACLAVLAATGLFLARERRSNRILAALNVEVEESRRKLQASEQAFRTLVEHSPDIIIRYDLYGRRLYVNPTMVALCGGSAAELVGKSPDASSALDDPGRYLAKLREVVATGREVTDEFAFRNAAGELRWGQSRLLPEYGPDGKVASILAVGRDITDLLNIQHRLEESRRELRLLAARRESAREEERRRIAREIHDELGQQLTALRLKVNILNFRFGRNEPALREATDDLLVMVDRTIQVARDVSTALRPAVLDMGIVAALEWLAAEFRRNTGIPCDLILPPKDVRPREDIGVVLFRTAQESLTNATRHAEARQVRIALSLDDGHYILEIADDGVGFDINARQRNTAFGLLGIRERAHAAGGNAVVRSTPGRGTTVRIRIPIQSGDDHPSEGSERQRVHSG